MQKAVLRYCSFYLNKEGSKDHTKLEVFKITIVRTMFNMGLIFFFFFFFSLYKDVQKRANYIELLDHPFIKKAETSDFNLTNYVEEIFEKYGEFNEQPS